jgi:oligoendopeptidase F
MQRVWTWTLLLAAASIALAGAQTRNRDEVPAAYKWNLADLYPSDDAWRSARRQLDDEFPKAAAFQGTLGQSPARLQAALDVQYGQLKTLARLSTYASLSADQDTRVSAYQAMRQEMTQGFAAFGAAWSFVEPELLAMDPTTLDRLIAGGPGLAPYTFYLRDVVRRRTHTLSAPEEQLLARYAPVASGAGTTSGLLLNADLPWPSITLAGGRTVRLDVSGYSAARGSADRADRQKAMEAFFGALGGFRRTLGTTFDTAVQAAMFEARARRYDSTLARALDAADIPTSVYQALVDGVNRQLPAFHRYLSLRKKLLGIGELHYYDLYAPLVAGVPLEYTVDQARDLVLASVAPLGTDYVAATRQAFDGRWIDFYPSPGKRSGAYMEGAAYDVHPYLLLNYNGRYTDVSTLAHELGHGMHSYFASKAQPFPTADYPIFVAEVASTFNEALLIEHMVATIADPRARLSLLGDYLEGVKSTVFRQTQFAEFELRAHEMAQKGQPLTGDALSRLYLDITRKYYGHASGVCVVDDYVADEWAFIQHFYRPFYVYQYATSFTASTALAEKALAKEPGAVDRYRAFLAAGGSDYPIPLLRKAGVDMTTGEPLDLTVRKMNRVMDEIERLLAAQK